MCQTTVISKSIGHIGRRSFDRRMRMASPLYVEKRGELARLLNDVDQLSERLHNDFPTITEEDYKMFGPELKILDLEELIHDIYVFRVKAPKNEELQATMAMVGTLDFSRFVRIGI